MPAAARPQRRPVTLVILDGFGCREATPDNAIARAQEAQLGPARRDVPAHVDRRLRIRRGPAAADRWATPRSGISTSAPAASSTRITRASITRSKPASSRAIPALTGAVAAARAGGATLHVLGLVSPGGVHSHERQIAAMVELAAAGGAPRIHVHAFLDGRDTPPRSAAPSLAHARRGLRAASRGAHRLDRRPLLRDGSRPALGSARRGLRPPGRRPRALHGRNAPRQGSRPPTRAARTTNSSAPRRSSRPAGARRRSTTATRSSS